MKICANSRRLRPAAAAAAGATAAAAAAWLLIPEFRGDLDEYNAAMKICDRRGRIMRVVLGRNDTMSEPIGLDQCGDWTVKALLAAEDKRFYRHFGVDFIAVCRAAMCNALSGRIVSGASTISMLVGKLAEPRPRSLWTKIVEAEHALRLERRLAKNEILEQYLNRAPFGGNIAGIEAAARRYFGKSAADLSLPEAALLVGLPQSPSRLRPDLHRARARRRRDYILERMKACGFITEAQLKRALAEEIYLARISLPFLAPHFCELVARTHPHQPVLETSLDLDMQSVAEKALRARLAELRNEDIRGGAVVVLDVKTGEVRAMAGSPDYFDAAADGQVNCAVARRSPGSALKPFIYAMALDRGICSPHSVVMDIPVNFAGYRPENFGGEFCGPVPARAALIRSLNIPALQLVREIGLDSLVQRLREAGFSTLEKTASNYGLSIAMGTCEVTLLELANAYACLARLGSYRDASLLARGSAGRQTRLFSEEAAYMVADILSGDERAADFGGHCADVRLPRIAWKTGTSSGQRDAWCIAYNPEYVVGVWLGNPNGRPSRALVGGVAAAPAAHAIFRSLYPNGEGPWFARPAGLKSRQVCNTSGLPPNAFCPATAADDYIPGVTTCAKCAVHRLAAAESGPSCSGSICETWPAEASAFLKSRGLKKEQKTEGSEAAGNASGRGRAVVKIISPARNETFQLFDGTPFLRQEIEFRAAADAAGSEIYWFVDGRLYCRADGDSAVLWPLERGRHVISCCDGSGRGDSAEITVQ